MALREDIHSAQIDAMKQRDSMRMNVLRMMWSAIRNEEINVQHELRDDEIQALIARQVKQAQDAIQDFKTGNRSDLVAQTEAEIAIMQVYLPAQLSDEELETAVKRVISALDKSSANIGQIMGAVMKEVKGKADGNRVRAMVQKNLT